MCPGKFKSLVSCLLLIVFVQGCENSGGGAPVLSTVEYDPVAVTLIEDIPIVADDFVTVTFILDADEEPVSVEDISLLEASDNRGSYIDL